MNRTLIALLILAAPCTAQCFEWDASIGMPGLMDGSFSPYAGSLAVYDEGAGPRLFVGGYFNIAGTMPVTALARWDGAQWSAVGPLAGSPAIPRVSALGRFDDGSGAKLLVAGQFDSAGGTAAHNLAMWDGASWSALGSGLSDLALAFATFDDGSGPALIAGGGFTQAGSVIANGIAKWDGTNWSALGSGLVNPGTQNNSPCILALCTFDDGSGPKLYAGGIFFEISGVVTRAIARFDGTSWSSIGVLQDTTIGSTRVRALTVFDDGSGPALYVGGRFITAGGVPVKNIARFDGANWSSVGAGVTDTQNGDVVTLAAWDDGSSRKLVAGGYFTSSNGKALHGVGAWNGTQWKELRTGVAMIGLPHVPEFAVPRALAAYDASPGGAEELFVAGDFNRADNLTVNGIAQYGACLPVGQTYCFGDGSLQTPCPCVPPYTIPNPSGGHDAGCANVFVLTGGKLAASGTTSPDSVRLLASDLSPTSFVIFISGNASDDAGVAYGDGVRCAGGSFIRFGGQYSSLGCVRFPNAQDASPHSLSQTTFVTPGSGAVRNYQLFYRAGGLNFCNPSTTNWTNAVTLVW